MVTHKGNGHHVSPGSTDRLGEVREERKLYEPCESFVPWRITGLSSQHGGKDTGPLLFLPLRSEFEEYLEERAKRPLELQGFRYRKPPLTVCLLESTHLDIVVQVGVEDVGHGLRRGHIAKLAPDVRGRMMSRQARHCAAAFCSRGSALVSEQRPPIYQTHRYPRISDIPIPPRMSIDPYHAVQQEIQTSLQTASQLRSSYLRIRNMAKEDSEELMWARNEVCLAASQLVLN